MDKKGPLYYEEKPHEAKSSISTQKRNNRFEQQTKHHLLHSMGNNKLGEKAQQYPNKFKKKICKRD